MASIEYLISIDLPGTSSNKAWEVLTDFRKYPEWNTVLRMSNNDTIDLGKKFHVTIFLKNGGNSSFKATALSKDTNKSFIARQKILGKWFFSASHHFIIKESHHQVSLVQKWELTGIISWLFQKQIVAQLSEFIRMNKDFKARLGNILPKN